MLSSDGTAISIREIGKRYEIYRNPSDRLKQFLIPKLLSIIGLGKEINYFDEFWALKNISFDVEKKETLGVIGRNGSGKSTLLQLICGIITPTDGQISAYGRIAALLELGSGFNPEFTGKENIFLNASLLGLSRAQIQDRYTDIIRFADIGEFINQPVKTYSSGMVVRLAFAVIAHVDADILIIDEALAVGDAIFTQKCMRFIREFREKGTLIFVSHDMASIQNLCGRVIWLEHGKIRREGPSRKIADEYLEYSFQEIIANERVGAHTSIKPTPNSSKFDPAKGECLPIYESIFSPQNNLNESNGWKTSSGEITEVEFTSRESIQSSIFRGGEVVRLKIGACIYQKMENPILGFLVRDRLGQDLFGENTFTYTQANPIQGANSGDSIEAEFIFKLPFLPNGDYTVMTSLADGNLQNNIQHHWLHEAAILRVSSQNIRYGLVGIAFIEVGMRKV